MTVARVATLAFVCEVVLTIEIGCSWKIYNIYLLQFQREYLYWYFFKKT